MNFSVLLVVAIVISTYLAMARYQRWAAVIGLSGVGAILVMGWSLGSYDLDTAQRSVNLSVLLMVICLGLFTDVLASSKFFEVVGVRLCRKARANSLLLLILFNLLTFFLSCLLNNLAVIFTLLPIVLVISKGVGFSPNYLRLMTISMVISSNVGGASTMLGDLPNMILATEKGIPFGQFLWAMAPINTLSEVVFLLVMIMLHRRSNRQSKLSSRQNQHETRLAGDFASRILEFDTRHTKICSRYLNPCVIAGVFMLLGFIMSGFLHYPLVLVALLGTVSVLITVPNGYQYLKEARLRDALLLGCLFVLASAVQETGFIDWVSDLILKWSGGNCTLAMIFLIVLSGGVTSVVSAGPTTATMLPLASSLTAMVPGSPNLAYFALSFGVLAGSSVSVYAATAGPIAASKMEEVTGIQLRFIDFIKIGWMAFIIFEIVSCLFVAGWLTIVS